MKILLPEFIGGFVDPEEAIPPQKKKPIWVVNIDYSASKGYRSKLQNMVDNIRVIVSYHSAYNEKFTLKWPENENIDI